jgi:predicted dehydrogenase
MSRKVRLGFAGVGWIGRHRMQALLDAGIAEATAIADIDDACALDALALAPGAIRCESFESLLNQELDGVVIATPSAAHAAQAIAAFDRGHAVFCQKPLGRHGDEVADVVDAARSADRRLGVDLSYRHLAGMAEVRRLVQSGELGHVYAAQAVFHNAYGPGKEWFYDRRLSGGGCVIDLGIHMVDLALWLLGERPVSRVQGSCFVKGQPLHEVPGAVEDYASGRLCLDNGTLVDLACSWNLPIGVDAEITLRLYGTHGGIGLRNVDGSFYDFMIERFDGRQRTVLAGPPDAWGGRAAIEWARGLQASPAYDPAADSLVTLARVLDRFYAG